jgi:lysophospholipase L1-like esterase
MGTKRYRRNAVGQGRDHFEENACRRRGRLGGMSLVAVAVSALTLAPPVLAGPSSKHGVVVSLGDSYISGTAGQWAGNSISMTGSFDGTDRACQPAAGVNACATHDQAAVYVDGTNIDQCKRSDVSEVISAGIRDLSPVNVACAGATTDNIPRAIDGGQPWKGEQPQGDALATVAKRSDVRVIVITIGGNDLGLASAVVGCARSYLAAAGHCVDTQKARVDGLAKTGTSKVTRALRSIRSVMRGAGYANSDYRLIAQGYPSPVPRASELRYGQAGADRTTYGCPFYDADANWVRDDMMSAIAADLRAAAHATGAELLDVRDLFQGREICSKTSALVTGQNPPSPTRSEWARGLSVSTLGTQAPTALDDSLHPNAFGQRALGACLNAVVLAGKRGDSSCTNVPTTAATVRLETTARWCVVPRVDGLTLAKATKELASAGCRVRAVRGQAATRRPRLRTHPTAGTQLKLHATVDLRVGA